jgi:SOS-response transcriptional repressor LexA
MKAWPESLRELMKKHGDTQETLAEKIDVTQGLIGHYLNKRRMAPIDMIEKIAVLYNIAPEILLYGDEGKNEIKYISKPTPRELPVYSMTDVIKVFMHKKKSQSKRTLFTPLPVSKDSFFMEIEGKAMISTSHPENSLLPGAFVLVDPEIIPYKKALVVAVIDNKDLKVRQFSKDGTEKILEAFNNDFPLIRVNEKVKIIGVIVGTFKSFKMPSTSSKKVKA